MNFKRRFNVTVRKLIAQTAQIGFAITLIH